MPSQKTVKEKLDIFLVQNNFALSSKVYKALILGIATIHLVYLFIFLFCKIYPLFIFNILSVILFLFLEYPLHKKKYDIVILLAYAEIFVHIAVCTFVLGWDLGFHLQYFALIAFPFYIPFKDKRAPYLLSMSAMLMFISIKILTASVGDPLYSVSPAVLNNIYLLNCIVAAAPIVVFSSIFHILINSNQSKLSQRNKYLLELASTDPLTGLLNRRSMISKMEVAHSEREAHNKPFSIILIDIDDFKKVNDTYGHDCGDFVLKSLSNILMHSIKKNDYVCRWGGEEMLILLNNCDHESAKQIGDNIRFCVESYDINYKGSVLRITITIGLTSTKDTIEEMLIEADKRLYCGKKSGKNCVVCS